jgi:multiple sugar transport system permease protein
MTPIVWMVFLSIRPAVTNRNIPPVLLFKPTLKYYRYCFVEPGVSRNYLIASLVIAGAATGMSIPFSILAAYAFSRFRFYGRNFLMLYYLGLFLGPPIVFLIPFFLIMSNIGWTEKYQSMIIIFQTFTIPFSVLIMKSFFDEVPASLEEAAMVDGANSFSHGIERTAYKTPACGDSEFLCNHRCELEQYRRHLNCHHDPSNGYFSRSGKIYCKGLNLRSGKRMMCSV